MSGSPNDYVAVIVNGVTVNVDPTTIAALVGGIFVTPTATFTFTYGGVNLEFANGVPESVDAGLQAALVASGAPVV